METKGNGKAYSDELQGVKNLVSNKDRDEWIIYLSYGRVLPYRTTFGMFIM